MSGYDDDEAVDFALVVYREENVWRVEEISDDEMGVFPDYEAFCAAAG